MKMGSDYTLMLRLNGTSLQSHDPDISAHFCKTLLSDTDIHENYGSEETVKHCKFPGMVWKVYWL